MIRGALMGVNNGILYIKAKKNVKVRKRAVTLGDVLDMESADKTLPPKLKPVRILKMPEERGGRRVISILKVIGCIHGEFPSLQVQSLGGQDIIVTYEAGKAPGRLAEALKTAFVALVTFFGSAFSIMAFHNDVSLKKLFGELYFFLTGSASDGFTVLELTYSLGLIVGILVFFNRFGRKKFTVDPTPMEVQMRLYENDIQTALIDEASREGAEADAGSADNIGGGRL